MAKVFVEKKVNLPPEFEKIKVIIQAFNLQGDNENSTSSDIIEKQGKGYFDTYLSTIKTAKAYLDEDANLRNIYDRTNYFNQYVQRREEEIPQGKKQAIVNHRKIKKVLAKASSGYSNLEDLIEAKEGSSALIRNLNTFKDFNLYDALEEKEMRSDVDRFEGLYNRLKDERIQQLNEIVSRYYSLYNVSSLDERARLNLAIDNFDERLQLELEKIYSELSSITGTGKIQSDFFNLSRDQKTLLPNLSSKTARLNSLLNNARNEIKRRSRKKMGDDA